MSDTLPTLTRVMRTIAEALTPLAEALAAPETARSLLAEIGATVDQMPECVLALRPKAEAVRQHLSNLNTSAAGADFGVTLALSTALADLTSALIQLGPALVAELGSTSTQPARPEAGLRLVDLLLVDAFATLQPALHAALQLLGVFERHAEPVSDEPVVTPDLSPEEAAFFDAARFDPLDGSAQSVRPIPHYAEAAQTTPVVPVRKIRTERLQSLLKAPQALLGEVFAWGSADFDGTRMLRRLADLARQLGLPASLVGASGGRRDSETTGGDLSRLYIPIYRAMAAYGTIEFDVILTTLDATTEDGSDPGIAITPQAGGSTNHVYPLGDGWTLILTGDMDMTGSVRIVFRPSTGPTIERTPTAPTDSTPSGTLSAVLRFAPPQGITVVSQPDVLSVAARALEMSAGLLVDDGGLTPQLGIILSGGLIELMTTQGDGFLRSLIPHASASMDVGLQWTPTAGYTLVGSADLAITIPLHQQLGPLWIDLVRLAIVADESAALLLEATVSAAAQLGPLIGYVEGIGVALPVRIADTGGNLGRLQLDPVRFVPPTGLAVAIDAGVVSGGGFLKFDADAGEYAGVLALELLTIGISAYGLINTKLPGGDWSFFLGLFIEVPSVPLGFGFTLNGVGGVAGVNRTLDADGLQASIRSGALDKVLFPEDPIADAPLMIDAVQATFPSAPGRYVFGPVIQIGWGTPTLIEAEIGIVISLPDPIVIAVLGAVSSVLPTQDVDLVALHLEVAGVIDTGAGTLSIDSSLYGSHIVGFPLSGGMALRSTFGDEPTFLMALGGSHPGFERPDKFPQIDRLSLAINAGELIDIRFDCYFALAANSLQFGAAFELTAEVEGFGINGGAEFDALITFSPFSLQTALGYHISVKAAGVDLLAVWLDVTLSGPNPWHIVGTATFTVLGIDTPIKLDQKIGAKEREKPPETEDVLGQLRAAVALPEAWSVGTGGGHGVFAAAGDPRSDDLVVTPDGTLGISQKVVPLDISIDKSVPWQIEGGYNRFNLEANAPGMASTGALTDWFVVSSYKDLNPRERLSAPSFERLKSGIEFGGGDPTAGEAREGTLDYEHILRDPELDDATVPLSPFNLRADARADLLAEMATGQVTRGFSIATDIAPIEVVSPGFAVTDRLTGAVLGRHRRWTASRSSAAGQKAGVTIVPAWEIAHE